MRPHLTQKVVKRIFSPWMNRSLHCYYTFDPKSTMAGQWLHGCASLLLVLMRASRN
jgi:hypothetical protein